MSAFGSYAGLVEVKFDKVNHGIFLITGDTGAGKTTIFDAITYALYDETSGGKRDGDMMRSEYAAEDTPTFVEFTFLYQDKEYTIKRNPNYARLSKRRNKDGDLTLTQESATVELIMPDGRPYYGKVKETNQKIVEIIGLDVNQFTQIAMIAQGEFMKLLHAPSKERKEIFSRIFNTKIYYKIQRELNDRAKDMYHKLDDNLRAIQFEIGKVMVSTDSSYQEEWKKCGNYKESEPEAVLNLLSSMIEELIVKEKKLGIDKQVKKEELEQLKEEITKGQELNQMFDALDQVMHRKEDLDKKKEEVLNLQLKCILGKKAAKVQGAELLYSSSKLRTETRKDSIKQLDLRQKKVEETLSLRKEQYESAKRHYEEQSPQLHTMITRLNEALPIYEKLSQIRVAINLESRQESSLILDIDKLGSTQLQLKQQLEDILLQQEQLKGSDTALITLTQELKELKLVLEDIKMIQEIITEVTELEIKENNAKEETTKALQLYQARSQVYERLNESFILEQVGIIASGLKTDMPCPVCGSTTHPNKAVLSEHAVTQQAVEAAKQERETADEAKRIQSESLQDISKQVALKKQMLSSLYERLFSEEMVDLTNGCSKINQKQQEARLDFSTKKAEYQKQEAQKQSFEQNQKKIVELTDSLETKQQNQGAKKEELTKLQVKIAAIQREEVLLKEGLPYEDIDTLQKNLAAYQTKLVTIQNEKSVSEDNYTKLQEQYQQIVGQLESEQKELLLLNDELGSLERQYVQAIKEQGFEDEVSYHVHKLDATIIEANEKKIKGYELETANVEANLTIYQAQTKAKQRVVLSELIAKKEESETQVKTLESIEKEYYSIHTNNQSIEENLKRHMKSRVQIKKEYERVNRLDRTANGKLAGMAGLDFQTYIQRRYFHHIIHEANRRLSIMTSNRFILQCREFKDLSKQGEVGLDLDVYSLVTDKSRDVKTLSGGESFMAALAMALGMADVMQHTAGKIHLDTMFIDEGFGSLDDESRAQAIRILNELAGDKRLVGIISHVTELKEQIDRKLVVKKDQTGSRVSWVY